MKSISNIRILTLSLIMILGLSAQAQTLNGLYFLEGNDQRNNLNPAFTSESNYITFPALGNVYIGVNSNVGLSSFLTPVGDELVTFLHKDISVEDALSNFNSYNTVEANIGLNILSFGFNSWGGSNSVALNIKSITGVYIPEEIFTFLKSGQTSDVTTYTIPEIDIYSQNYAELAFGHARDINDKLSVGAKVKALFGIATVDAQIQDMEISMSDSQWKIKQNATITTSSLIGFNTNSKGEIEDIEMGDFALGGFGLGLDLGAVYKINDDITVSLAVTDIGFISWNNCNSAYNAENEFVYTGFDNIGSDDDENGNNAFDDSVDETTDALEALVTLYDGGETSKTTSLYTTIRAAGEYGILNNKISFGLLGTVKLGAPETISEGMLTANFRPISWFNASINGSVSNISSSMGAALNIHPKKGANFFIGMDYLLATYNPQFIPVNSTKMNLSFGLSFNY